MFATDGFCYLMGCTSSGSWRGKKKKKPKQYS